MVKGKVVAGLEHADGPLLCSSIPSLMPAPLQHTSHLWLSKKSFNVESYASYPSYQVCGQNSMRRLMSFGMALRTSEPFWPFASSHRPSHTGQSRRVGVIKGYHLPDGRMIGAEKSKFHLLCIFPSYFQIHEGWEIWFY